jgi:hypothetical protein
MLDADGQIRASDIPGHDLVATLERWLTAANGPAEVVVDGGPALGRVALRITRSGDGTRRKGVMSPPSQHWRRRVVPALLRQGRIPAVLANYWRRGDSRQMPPR